jgi:hypothetical protein
MAPVEVLSTTEILRKLNNLRALIRGLPESLPLDAYQSFLAYNPSEDLIEDYGDEVSAVNRDLEVGLCPKGRMNGLVLVGRGPGLAAVVEVVARFLRKYPDNVILQKWLQDLFEAAEKAGAVLVSCYFRLLLREAERRIEHSCCC